MPPVIPGTITAESTRRTEQLWKTHDIKAQKEGAHHTVYWVSGERYQGEWSDNKRHGKGTVVYKNGDKYEGDWANGLRHGLGTLWIFKGGKYIVRYNGEWRQDTPTAWAGQHDVWQRGHVRGPVVQGPETRLWYLLLHGSRQAL
ncbi:MORN repeat-containing protein 3, partial [Haematococcus lacustris]